MTDSERQQLRNRIIATYWRLREEKACQACPQPEPRPAAAQSTHDRTEKSDT